MTILVKNMIRAIKFIPLSLVIWASLVSAEAEVLSDFDFSRCGYLQNEAEIPLVPAIVEVAPISGDATAVIQQAIDAVSSRPLDANGFRGAVLLARGTFDISGSLRISTSGVILRGRGQEETILHATGNGRRTLIEVRGNAPRIDKRHTVVDSSVKAGAIHLTIDQAARLSVGESVFIEKPSGQEWIESLGMNEHKRGFDKFRLNWLEGSRDVRWDRTITHINGNTVTLDIPLTTEVNAELSGAATLLQYSWRGRIENVGVENLRCVSAYDTVNTKDEEHAWMCVQFGNAKNCWVRNLTAQHFVSSAVRFDKSVSQSTVEFCQSIDPVSEIGGRRRVAFYNGGQLNLFKNCFSRNGRHDFVVGFCSAGPNVFKDCTSENALSFSGSFESWACGALFENVSIGGDAIRFSNIGEYCDGMGWSGSQCVLWNCTASELDADHPPGSQNHIYGGQGDLVGDVAATKAEPTGSSFFVRQLATRINLKASAASYSGPYVFDQNESPPPFVFVPSKQRQGKARPSKKIEIVNGRFVVDGNIFWSGHDASEIWNDRVPRARPGAKRPCLVRWVPGYDGNGYTDDLDEVAQRLVEENRKLFAFTPPLWYDRRRMAHDVVARTDGDVVAPFLELPWARSGQGVSHEGLSQYDLEKFNPWYFNRIDQFARQCDEQGILLYHEFYNNHWLIEAGAHWPDMPWRPANSLQNTGMTEPVPFHYKDAAKTKPRIAIADEFYDISDPNSENRRLHQLYILQCLDNLKERDNVLHTLAFQDTAPIEFARFFLDLVRDWQIRNGRELMLALKAAKNITDALLADPEYAEMISVIDLRYWQYLEDGSLYAPEGGKNKAYREYRYEAFGRNQPIPPSTPQLLYQQVREYRDASPEKAIIAYRADVGALPVLMAGGAYTLYGHETDTSKLTPEETALQQFIHSELSDRLWKMTPDDSIGGDPSQLWCLADPGETYLIYSTSGEPFNATIKKGHYEYRWFTPSGEALTSNRDLKVNKQGNTFSPPKKQPGLLLLKSQNN